METWQAYLVLCPAALIGGAINSVAGGGTLITFPALLWALSGTPGATIIANATNTVALCPGALSGSWGYRRELRDLWGWVRWLALPSLIGGIAGSWIVVVAPEASFKAMIPWLIGLATALFILQPRLTPTRKSISPVSDSAVSGAVPNTLTAEKTSPRYLWLVCGLQLLIGLYGGYFGAGLGILMLSTLSLLQLGTIHQVNGLKTALAGMINGIAVVVFMASGSVNWKLAVPMLVSASIGGWLGATMARRMDRSVVRRIVIAIGISLTTWYFAQQWYFATPDSPAGSSTSAAPVSGEPTHGNQ
ncbi:MAG: sulfite exporter TauE/SafE family protein [Planctomycetaceae bacterium]